MPQKSSNQPPEVMTWGGATPYLVVAFIFDALRFMFTWFIFFGPALAALACVAGVNSFFGIDISGVVGKGVAAACVSGATAAGFFGSTVTGTFGIIMAMATGLAGWLTVGLLLVIFNGRIFKENALWFGASLLVGEIPFLNSLPAITFAVWRMFSNQIRVEKATFQKWQEENTASQQLARNQRTALMQAEATQLAQEGIY